MNKNLSILIIVIFVGLFFIWFLWFINKISPAEKRGIFIIDTEPNNQEVDIPIDREISIYLNSPTKLNKRNIKIEPFTDFEIEFLEKKRAVKITPIKFLEKNTNYKIVIKSKAIKNSPYEVSFKTGNFAESTLKQDIILLLKLKNKIPVYSSIFDLTYLEDKEEFAVIINTPDCKKARDSVLEYLIKNGVNPNEIKINWYSAVKADLSCVKVK